METIIERAKEWTTEDFDVETRKAVAEMIEKQVDAALAARMK